MVFLGQIRNGLNDATGYYRRLGAYRTEDVVLRKSRNGPLFLLYLVNIEQLFVSNEKKEDSKRSFACDKCLGPTIS